MGPPLPLALLPLPITLTCFGWTSFSLMAFGGCWKLPEAGGSIAGLAVGASSPLEPGFSISPQPEPLPKNTPSRQGLKLRFSEGHSYGCSAECRTVSDPPRACEAGPQNTQRAKAAILSLKKRSMNHKYGKNIFIKM